MACVPPPPKESLSQFDTPTDLAEAVAKWACIAPGTFVLEPSAGMGNLACAVRAEGGEVTCVEIDPDRVEYLRAQAFEVAAGDFLALAPRPVDLVVANPPYEDGQDLDHVLAMLEWAPRVVAVLPLGMLDGVERQRWLWSRHTLSRLRVLVRRFKATGTDMGGQRPFGIFEVLRGRQDVRQSIEWL